MHKISESTVKDTTFSWFKELSYEVLFGPDIAFDGLHLARLCAAFGAESMDSRFRGNNTLRLFQNSHFLHFSEVSFI